MTRGRLAALVLLVLFYGAAGILHLRSPAAFLAIMPPWVPWPRAVVLATGVAELAGALGLMVPRLRRSAGWGLAAYALCVFPANIHHALAGVAVGGTVVGWGYHAPRLLLQPVIIWWALFAAGVTDWPFGGRSRACSSDISPLR